MANIFYEERIKLFISIILRRSIKEQVEYQDSVFNTVIFQLAAAFRDNGSQHLEHLPPATYLCNLGKINEFIEHFMSFTRIHYR